MNPITTTYNPMIFRKFDEVCFVDKGLILMNKNEETSISLSEIEKIYIKKHKLSFEKKLVILSFLALLIFASLVFLSIEIVLMLLILYIPILVWMHNFKSYRMNLIHQSNSLYFKKFYNVNKQDHINLVNIIRKEIFYNRDSFPVTNREVVKPVATPAVIEDYSIQSLSIA